MDEKAAWVQRVLGVTPGATGRGGDGALAARGWRQAREAWTTASETVDRQIGAHQGVLRLTGDPELIEIAEFGLNAMTGGFKTRLLAALMDMGDQDPAQAPQSARKALAAVQGLRGEIAADPRVAACDANPGGVPVAIQATLLQALDGLASALSAASP